MPPFLIKFEMEVNLGNGCMAENIKSVEIQVQKLVSKTTYQSPSIDVYFSNSTLINLKTLTNPDGLQ